MAGGAGGDEAWFVYRRTAGRITAMPANWKGWTAFVAAIAVNIAVAYALMALTAGLDPLLRLALLIPAIGGGVWLIARLAVAKGRPTD
jgi:uncharacterized membrane-anchored protein